MKPVNGRVAADASPAVAVVLAEEVLDAVVAEPSGVTVVVGAGVAAGALLDDVEPDEVEPDELEPEEALVGLVPLDEGELDE